MTIEYDRTEPLERVKTVKSICQIRVTSLPAGDWVLYAPDNLSVGIEIKTVGSLLGSFVDGTETGQNRLYAECEDCRAAWDVGLLVVLGIAGRDRGGFLTYNHKPAGSWLWQTYQSILFRLFLRGIQVVQVDSDFDFALLLQAWEKALQRQSLPSARARQVLAFPPALAPPARVFAALPGLGPELGLRAWEGMGSLEMAAQAPEEEWRRIPGIGQIKSKEIRRVMTARTGDFTKE